MPEISKKFSGSNANQKFCEGIAEYEDTIKSQKKAYDVMCETANGNTKRGLSKEGAIIFAEGIRRVNVALKQLDKASPQSINKAFDFCKVVEEISHPILETLSSGISSSNEKNAVNSLNQNMTALMNDVLELQGVDMGFLERDFGAAREWNGAKPRISGTLGLTKNLPSPKPGDDPSQPS